MTPTPRGWACVLTLAVVLAQPHFAAAQTPRPIQQGSLKGFPGVCLVVEDLGDDAKGDGLTAEMVKADVEKALNDAGIRILKVGEAAPTLYVNVIPAIDCFDDYTVRTEIDLLQTYQPLPADREQVRAFIWQQRIVSKMNRRVLDNVREVIMTTMDAFVADWQSANGKR